jgi:hypothetical protein
MGGKSFISSRSSLRGGGLDVNCSMPEPACPDLDPAAAGLNGRFVRGAVSICHTVWIRRAWGSLTRFSTAKIYAWIGYLY